MYREQYGEYGYWCQVVFSTLFSISHLCFRKATSVKKEESSKAKKNRRPISLDSGKEIMCTYWGYPILFMWRVIGRFCFHRNHDFNFFLYLFFVFVSWIVIKDDKIFPCLCQQFFSLFKHNLWMENEMNQMWLANHFVYLTNFGLFQRAKLVELTAMSMGKKEWKF